MTKPIEWTTTENMPVIFWHRMHVDESGELRDATPSDLVAALAAMGEGERAEVLAAFHGDSIVHRHLQERVEDAERERDRMAREFGTRPGELPDDGEIARVVRERAEFRDRVEKAERESRCSAESASANLAELHRAEVRIEELMAALNKAERKLDTALECDADRWDITRGTLGAINGEFTVDAARRVVAERDRLRTRAIAAETAAAQREPESPTRAPLFSAHTETSKQKEYPLERGSRFVNDTVEDGCGTVTTIVGGTSGALVIQWGAGYPFLADVLALAHRRGLL
jgi:hypothetical protein